MSSSLTVDYIENVTQEHVDCQEDVDDDGSSLASLLLDQRVGEVGDVWSDTGGGVVIGIVFILILCALGGSLSLLGNFLQSQLCS